jgi:4-cresol dehydrogenase (hydroxylating) flavoprotein subunit
MTSWPVVTGALSEAIQALRDVLGAANVVTEPAQVADYEKATFATSQRIPCVALPASTAEVQAVLKIANRYKFPVYPISRGRNWGLGSRVPVQDGCCVLDLRRMNKIVDFNERDAVLTVEPGVTFEQAAAYLAEQGSELYMTAIGGPPDSSVLANALERGDGVGPIGDRARYCGGLEVVLPSGECVHTGLEPFENSLTGKLAHFGLGPGVEALFFQSNLGVVTRMSVLLGRRPANFQLVVFAAHSEAEVTAATDAIHELQQRGVFADTSYSLWNVYRFLTAQTQYPWDSVKTLTPAELLARLPATWRGVKWVGFVGVYSASVVHAFANRWMIRRALKGKVSRFFVVDAVVATIGRFLQAPLQRLTGIDVRKMLDNLYFRSVFVGVPTKLETSSIYWRKRAPAPETCDPDRDRCGLHWICVSLPFDGAHVVRVTSIVERIALGYQLEPMCMFFNMSQWYLKSFVVIMYDQDAPGEEEAARRCHDELLAELTRSGYAPVRLGIQSMSQGVPSEASYVELIRSLKNLLDPNDILAPGRYDFRSAWPDRAHLQARPRVTDGDRTAT